MRKEIGEKKEIEAQILESRLIKRIYKYFEKSMPTLPMVRLMETFVGCLRYQEKSSNVDVELYLRKIKGL
jgi:hypothetical protein